MSFKQKEIHLKQLLAMEKTTENRKWYTIFNPGRKGTGKSMRKDEKPVTMHKPAYDKKQ